MEPPSPAKFVKPGDLFQIRRVSRPIKSADESPLKLSCLNNINSPAKKCSAIMKNPFRLAGSVGGGRQAKRKLQLGSPTKKCRRLMIDDEDANQEAPKLKPTGSLDVTNHQQGTGKITKVCTKNDWTLRTLLRINFDGTCRNWTSATSSTHLRHKDSPSKLNDKTISLEAIRNVATVYQHPYFSWLPLYPRGTSDIDVSSGKRKAAAASCVKDPQMADMIHDDWCESLNDLANLLICGKCPYFYLCSDHKFNILFKSIPTSNPKKPLVQAYISRFPFNMGLQFDKLGIGYRCTDGSTRTASDSSTTKMGSRTSSVCGGLDDRTQDSSFSQQTRASMFEQDNSQASLQNGQSNCSKLAKSVDSGNVSDDEFLGDDENDDASQFLEGLGIEVTNKDFSTILVKRQGFIESDSNTNQTKVSSYKQMAVVEGTDNIRKLVTFLQTSRSFVTTRTGKFANIPSTLLAPSEFRLSTPQYPEVKLVERMIDPTSSNSPMKKKTLGTTTIGAGPRFIELRGTILPTSHEELHKLLTTSDNLVQHTCTTTALELSKPFGTIQLASSSSP